MATSRRETTGSGSESVAGAQTIARALTVLGLLRDTAGDVSVTEVARALGLHVSTAHRIVRALLAAGYVAQDTRTERYRLGHEAFLLGHVAGRALGYDATMPVLERLARDTGESVNLVVRDGDHGLVVLRVESQQPLRFAQSVGDRVPLYCTSTGKVLLAFSGDAEAEVARVGELERLTPSTITSPRDLLSELEKTAARGYGVNECERVPGVCGVAAPVLGSAGTASAAVAVQGPQIRLSEGRIAELGPIVMETVRGLAAIALHGYAS